MEVPFLVVLSLISGVVSKELGTYYLVGAFVVGLIGSRFKEEIFKGEEEGIFKALNSFFNVFLPFYFFQAGMSMSFGNFTPESALIGSFFVLLFVPLRLILTNLSLRLVLKNFVRRSYEISLSLMPTLIFGLVVANILSKREEVPTFLIYALIFYTLVTSLLPSILFPLQRILKKK
jgi:Kef-type K+ transport system membrane component KefB